MSTFLVVEHQTAASTELRDALLAKKQEDRRAIFVLLTPATPVEKLLRVSGGDSTTLAEQSIQNARSALESAGIDLARAIVGDADPLTAIEQEFSRAGKTYDGVFLCTFRAASSRWQESGLPAQIEDVFGVPLTHVVASGDSVTTQGSGHSLTFSVRLGSGGAEIAQLVAQALGLSYYDWEITAAAAELAGVAPSMVAVSERAQTLLERVLDRMGSTGVYLEEEAVGRLSSATMSSAVYALSSSQHRELVEDVVRELAFRGGCVLVGHAGQVVLRNVPGVFKVLITGSAEARAQRVAVDEGRSIEDAATLVRESDTERRAFFKQTYNVDLLDSSLYDLTLNTDQISSHTATSIIVDAFKRCSLKLQEATA